jgi:hypothetical protein
MEFTACPDFGLKNEILNTNLISVYNNTIISKYFRKL